MSVTIKDVLGGLNKVRKSGRGWMACCPAHEDKKPSLAVYLDPDGHIGLTCFAGCRSGDIWQALRMDQRKIEGRRRDTIYHEPAREFGETFQTYLLDTTTPRLDEYSKIIGVSVDSLRNLEARRDQKRECWAFPMREADDKICGIRLRWNDGTKKAILGSSGGLFIPRNLRPDGPLGIAEGPTDTMAVLDLGFACIGRESCDGGGAKIQEFVKNMHRDIIIFSNRDAVHYRPITREKFFPGQDGARKLANRLCTSKHCKIIEPPGHKDFRQWLVDGCTHEYVEQLIESRRWWIKEQHAHN
jgi:hypothetical protein